jgi:hypothetical protein
MSECSQGKHEYSTRNQAHVSAKKSGARNVRVYQHEGHWHFTRSEDAPTFRRTTPKGRGPKPFIPSACKLRRKIENCGRELRFAERAYKRVEELRILAERSQAVYKEELAAIEIMVNRLHRV